MGKTLPKNWVEAELGNLTYIQSGGTPSRGKKEYWEGSIPWVKISDIKGLYVDEVEEYITEDGLKNSSAKIFDKGTLLFTIFATIGKVGILNIDAATNQAIAGITPYKFVSKMYLAYILTNLSNTITDRGKGIAQKNINLTILKETLIPLPPLPEQERIANKLDALFSQLDNIHTAMERIPLLLKNFRQQVLTQAVTGKLTEEWREGKELEDWRERTIENIAELKSGYAFKSSDFVDDGIQLIRMGNLYNNILDLNRNPVFLPHDFSPHILEQYSVKKDDILLTLTGTKYKRDYGYAIRIQTDNRLLLNQRILSLTPKINPIFLMYLLRGSYFRDQFFSFETGGVNQGNVGVKNVATIRLSVPPLSEQQEIVRRVESLFTQADAIEQQYQSLKKKIDNLPQAILHKAFKGELVEQLPTDGDARDLLRQIKELKQSNKKIK